MTHRRLALASCPHDHQSNSSDECYRAQDWRNRHGFCFLVLDLDRSHVDDFFLVGERKPSQRKAYDADDDQKYSYASSWFHLVPPFSLAGAIVLVER
jgi:hypothetical protein